MAFPKVPISVIIVSIVFAALGGLWGAHAAGLIDLNNMLSSLPFVEKEQGEEGEVQISPLEEENKALLARIAELEGQLQELNSNTRDSQGEIEDLTKELAVLQGENEKLKDMADNANRLASYYQEMRPKEIVPIFEMLDDQIVLSILIKLEDDHVAKILAAMDPIRAAKLTRVLTD